MKPESFGQVVKARRGAPAPAPANSFGGRLVFPRGLDEALQRVQRVPVAPLGCGRAARACTIARGQPVSHPVNPLS